MAEKTNTSFHWWQTGVVYQIYPRSFMDSNNDGIGDLPGIIQRLDYLSETLGIDILWLSPIYASPMHDFGYDVADYCDIHPIFGTMDDFDRLLAETHKRDMKLILDLVPNHTSDEHPWFIESRSSLDNPKRDWYIWRDPTSNGGVPNNWLSFFGGPAWTFDEKTGQYYMHQFIGKQPELNYRNPKVVAALMDTMRFWLDKGVDGFRVDVIWLMIKDSLFRDEPPNLDWDGVNPHASLRHIYTADLPEVHDLIHQMRQVVDSYENRMMVGEIFLPNDQLVSYYGSNDKRECHLPFNSQLIFADWNASRVKRIVDEYESVLPLGAWPNWVLGSHDQHRLATRIGISQVRVANMLLLTLRGTPTCYYGDEIGMVDVNIPPEKIKDPPAINQPEIANIVGRDPERTPMQWDDSPNAGFASSSTTELWLPVSPDYKKINVSVEINDPFSILNFYRKLLTLRKSTPALVWGDYHAVEFTSVQAEKNCFVYIRQAGIQRILVALNFSAQEQKINLPEMGTGKLILSTALDRNGNVSLANFILRANEGCIVVLGQ